jgi:broad specificity phosphatase PhoE
MIVCSPRLRAKKTAEIIALELGYTGEIIVDDRLNEIREGVFL